MRSTLSIWPVPGPRRSSWTCSATTRAMSRCTPPSRPTSARTSPPSLRSGASTTRSSCRPGPRRSSGTCPVRSSASSTPAISPWKRMSRRSPVRSAPSSPSKSATGGPRVSARYAEMHMRRGEWAEAAQVIGIECVGLVHSCPGGEFPIGAKVAALMGGLGRTINGSYAEYTRVRASNVALIESDLPWAELAAIPEIFATAWTCLFRNLEIVRGQTLVIRGAASSFGQAALNMAVDVGVRVIATTRSRARVTLLEQLGAARVDTEGPELSQRIAEAKQLDAVLDLVGNSTILDSLAMLRRGGRACLAGGLGGLAPIAD